MARDELVICHLSGLGLSQQLQNCRRLDPLFKLVAVILYCIATPTAVLTPQHTNTGMAKEEKRQKKQALFFNLLMYLLFFHINSSPKV